jgi:hypothetical protein
MFISNGAGNELINTALVERFRIVEKPDACLIVASYGQDCDPVTAARYGTLKEAQEALRELFAEIEGMPHIVCHGTRGRTSRAPAPRMAITERSIRATAALKERLGKS